MSWRLPVAFALDAPFGYHVLAYGNAWSVDLASAQVKDSVRLSDLIKDAFPGLLGETSEEAARVRRERSLRAAIQSRPGLQAVPWVLIVWDRNRKSPWAVTNWEGTRALRVLHPESVQIEKVK